MNAETEDPEVVRRRYLDMIERQFSGKERPPEARSLPDDGYDATPERMAKAGGDFERFVPFENENWRATRMLDKHVLEYLQSRSIITGDQYAAGFQFYSDWYMAGLAFSGVIDPGRVIVDGGKSNQLSEVKLEAHHRWTRALRGVGKIHGGVLCDVLLLEETLEDFGRRRFGHKSPKLAKLAGQTAVQLALNELDLFYYGHRNTPARSSHAEDYRPSIPDQPDTS